MVPVMTFLHSTRFDTYHDGIWGEEEGGGGGGGCCCL